MLNHCKKYLIFFLLLSSCYKEPSKKKPDVNQLLIDKVNLYSELNRGYVNDSCDSLLFTGLAADKDIDLRAFYDNEKDMWRRNTDFEKCSPERGDSRSSISRDGLLGLMWGIWIQQDLELAEELLAHLRKHNYRLNGIGTIGELQVTPAMINTLARLVVKLGGKANDVELNMPVIYFASEGYVNHLQVWEILLRGEIRGKISSHEFNRLKDIKDKNPNNPLYQAAYHKFTDGNQTVAINILLNSSAFPNSSLPTNNDRCGEWVIQRDDNDSAWKPCENQEEYTGYELVVIYNRILIDSK